MLIIILSSWWGYFVSGAIFLALVIGGYFLGKWLFKNFLAAFFHEGEKRWDEHKD